MNQIRNETCLKGPGGPISRQFKSVVIGLAEWFRSLSLPSHSLAPISCIVEFLRPTFRESEIKSTGKQESGEKTYVVDGKGKGSGKTVGKDFKCSITFNRNVTAVESISFSCLHASLKSAMKSAFQGPNTSPIILSEPKLTNLIKRV